MSATELFSNPDGKAKFRSNKKYKENAASLGILKCFLTIHNPSIYVVDFCTRKFSFISTNPLFLCGYEEQDVLNWGFEYFPKVVPCDDLQMLKEIAKKGREFFSTLPVKLRDKFFISYDFRLTHKNGQTILVNNKFTPVYVTTRGFIKKAICIVEISTQKKPGNVFIQMIDKPCRYNYSFTKKEFIKSSPIILTNTEKQVLNILVYENSNDKIADAISRSKDTVKQHRKSIYHKLCVNNVADAIFFAQLNKLI